MLHCMVLLLLRLVDEVVGHSWHDVMLCGYSEKTCNHDVIGDFASHSAYILNSLQHGSSDNVTYLHRGWQCGVQSF
jgi:hypothetical protein